MRTLGVAAESGGEADFRGCADARRGLAYYRAAYAGWREKMGAGGSERARADARIPKPVQSCPHVRYLAARWREKARAARRAYELWFARTYEKYRCIHEHEGAWNDDDPPYWGGLQMTRWFQRTYGVEFYRRWGTADRWPVWAQLLAAERAWRECRCFRQWGTAGECGLR